MNNQEENDEVDDDSYNNDNYIYPRVIDNLIQVSLIFKMSYFNHQYILKLRLSLRG